MNLYLKYRPSSFEDVYGNEDVIEYLVDALSDLKSCPHTFLLHGPTGCGKTTIARIIKTYLNCEDNDFLEINTANFNGIATAREVIRGSKYHTMGGGARVYYFDEVHKMTGDAQNALLKTLEEPPPKTYFILCTTEPNKLLPTVRGRCIDLQMKPLSEEEMLMVLQKIVRGEGKKIKRSVLMQIAQDSLGLSRNAIQVLETVIKLPPEKQKAAAVRAAEQVSQSIELCRALINGTAWSKVKEILKGLKNEEPEGIRRHILGYAQSVLLNGENDRAALIIEEFWEPLYNIGYPGLVFACYSVTKG